jgi:Tol biopolymer transport system component
VLPVVAGILLVIGIGADAVLYRALGAVPDEPEVPAVANAQDPPPVKGEDPKAEDPKNNETDPAAKPPQKKGVEKIVFASDRDGKWHLWMMNPDGSGQEKISKKDRIHMQPRFSPDGTQVTFTTASTDGKHMTAIFDWKTREEKDVCEGDQAAFADGGKSLVFRRAGQIYHRSLETGAEKMISPKMWSKCSFPSASPDGKSVALASRLLAGYNIYIVPAAGGEPKILVGGQGTCDPRWSPSGVRLSYQTETNIYTIKPDGTDKFQATFGGGVQHYATWAPDEKKVAYCQGPGPNGPWQIYVVSLVEDEDPVKLTKEGSNIYPDWGTVERER